MDTDENQLSSENDERRSSEKADSLVPSSNQQEMGAKGPNFLKVITPPPALQPIDSANNAIMEVHNHGHVHETKKWKEYLFQFLMLFLAVTLGFFVENQREHYIEHMRVEQYARSLVHNLAKDTVMVNRIIREIKRGNANIDQLAAYVNSKKTAQLKNLDLFLLTAYGNNMYRPPLLSILINRRCLKKIKIRQNKYLNNRIEADHRFIKWRTFLVLEFKSFQSATRTLTGIEMIRMIKKEQVTFPMATCYTTFCSVAA